jgi:hypothetical protein
MTRGVRHQRKTPQGKFEVPMVTLLKTLKSIVPYSKLAVVYNPTKGLGSAARRSDKKLVVARLQGH